MNLRRRLRIRMQASARRFAFACFWLRNGYLLHPVQAWKKAGGTLS